MPNPLNGSDNLVGKSLQDPGARVTLIVAHSVTMTYRYPAYKMLRILKIDEVCLLGLAEDGFDGSNSVFQRSTLLRSV